MTPQRVNQARFLLGWSTEQLSRASGLSAAQVTTYEAGGWIHPLQHAADALRCRGRDPWARHLRLVRPVCGYVPLFRRSSKG